MPKDPAAMLDRLCLAMDVMSPGLSDTRSGPEAPSLREVMTRFGVQLQAATPELEALARDASLARPAPEVGQPAYDPGRHAELANRLMRGDATAAEPYKTERRLVFERELDLEVRLLLNPGLQNMFGLLGRGLVDAVSASSPAPSAPAIPAPASVPEPVVVPPYVGLSSPAPTSEPHVDQVD
jgi:hypothetical protein